MLRKLKFSQKKMVFLLKKDGRYFYILKRQHIVQKLWGRFKCCNSFHLRNIIAGKKTRTNYRFKNVLERDYHLLLLYVLCVLYMQMWKQCKMLKSFHMKMLGPELNSLYIRTDLSLLIYQKSLLNRNIGPQEFYKAFLENSVPINSPSMFKEPRNLKQIWNRQT